jgi:hypothetical protein
MDIELENLKYEFGELGLDINSLVHVLLIGSTEFVAEWIQDKKTKDYIFYNPIKVIRDTFIDDDGCYNSHNFLVSWNPCIQNDFIFVKPSSVVSISKPNKLTMSLYLDSIKENYYPEKTESPKTIPPEIIKDNIISFPSGKTI